MRSSAIVGTIAVVLSAAMGPNAASADETDARRILQAMSDYLAGLETFSFDYDAEHEVVTIDGEKLGIARSGGVSVARPDRVHATSVGGFSDLEMAFDGATFAVADGDTALHATQAFDGDLAMLIDTLRDTYARPLPAADLIVPDAFSVLMEEVTGVKDLGSGVIGGVECDHLAFRNAEVDWQIWIAQGDTPRPCRFVITTRDIAQAPQHRITVRDWRETADDAAFALTPSDGATEVDIETFASGAPTFPKHFMLEPEQ